MKTTAQQLVFIINYLISIIDRRRIIYSLCFIFNNRAPRAGFTLIEVLVAATILATLAGGVLLTLNPFEQINKGQDSQRMSDLQAVKTALDLYYSDTGCYPVADDGIPFGNEWRVGNTVYMKETPQDPSCSGTGEICYRYRTDASSSCPQWNVVFAQLSRNSAIVDACPLSSLSNCTPEGYDEGKFACVLSGGVDCNELLASSLLGGLETVGPTSTPVPGPTATPTPTPTYELSIPMPEINNPDAYHAYIDPARPNPGATQSFRLDVADPGVPITSVRVVVTSDSEERSFSLNPPQGTQNASGPWTATRQVGPQETFCDRYTVTYEMTAGSAPSQIVSYEALALISSGALGTCE